MQVSGAASTKVACTKSYIATRGPWMSYLRSGAGKYPYPPFRPVIGQGFRASGRNFGGYPFRREFPRLAPSNEALSKNMLRHLVSTSVLQVQHRGRCNVPCQAGTRGRLCGSPRFCLGLGPGPRRRNNAHRSLVRPMKRHSVLVPAPGSLKTVQTRQTLASCHDNTQEAWTGERQLDDQLHLLGQATADQATVPLLNYRLRVIARFLLRGGGHVFLRHHRVDHLFGQISWQPSSRHLELGRRASNRANMWGSEADST